MSPTLKTPEGKSNKQIFEEKTRKSTQAVKGLKTYGINIHQGERDWLLSVVEEQIVEEVADEKVYPAHC